MKKILFISALIFNSVFVFSQEKAVKWFTLEEAVKLMQKNPRPILIDTYTDWCGWCKKLDKDTFSNPVIADILNNKFYPVKFDAEGKDPVVFQGTTYINDGKAGKAHQLAVAMLKGQLAYPNIVFFNEKIQLLTNFPGYIDAKQMEVLLSFIAEKAYDKQNYQDFQKSFVGKVQ
jgi:thioredoxin-related protein